ncbi:MAG: ribonuclease P protein component [Candidatus Zixiibacteriota bacterium]|nr:MAG: ribonuclease P protein component [candidate division Zixibacteria bacterium]
MQGNDRLPRSLSLKSRAEISELLKKGHRFAGNYFTLVWRENTEFRYAILLSKRAGSAVQRNRVKRIFREAIRLSRSALRCQGKMLILPVASTAPLTLEQIRSDVTGVFEKLSAQS